MSTKTDTRAAFEKWWANARLLSEFRGCTMPAALAAWLAGVESVTGEKIEVVVPDEEPKVPKPPEARRIGKYKGAVNDGKAE